MNTTKWIGLVAGMILPLSLAHAQAPVAQPSYGSAPVQAAPVAPPPLSPAAAEVLQLGQAGTSEDVILAYIQNSQAGFNLSADQILYLRDVGISSSAITAMLNRDNALRGQPPAYGQTAPPPTPAPPPVPVQETVPPPPAAAPVYVSSPPPEVGSFYNDLAPYGAWIQLEGIGWCWQPSVVVINRSWRPYCDSGHWVWTDAGWFWQSDYSWGWAPFHYGRWQLHDRCGWVWLPDRVWGPAWVTWRVAGDNCGWAPLPPRAELDVRLGWRFNGIGVGLNFDFGLRPEHFTFVALHDFNDRDLGHRRLPPVEVTRVYRQTTIVNNYVVNNTTIVNQGVRVERVAAATHSEIRKVAIRDVPAGSPAAMPARGADRNGLAVYRPQLRAASAPAHMVAQKVDERHPVIQHPTGAAMNIQTRTTTSAGAWAPTVGARPAQPDNSRVSGRSSNDRPPTYQQGRPTTQPYQPVHPQPSAPMPSRNVEDVKPPAHPSTSYRTEPNPQTTVSHNPLPPQPAPTSSRVFESPKQAQHPYTPSRPEVSMSPAPSRNPAPVSQAPAPSRFEQPRQTVSPASPYAAEGNSRLNSSRGAVPQQPAMSQSAPVQSSRQAQPFSNPHVYEPKSYHQAAEAHALPPLNSRPASPSQGNPSSPSSKKGDS
ncbi:MAG TPA: DUF6600 domain-containing protein [Candidatus Binatia bacterium]|nr:DUF6600 domain-containing protein [Candidatus Binatia bacterium]